MIRLRLCAALLPFAALAACGGGGAPRPEPVSADGRASRIEAVVSLLDAGDSKAAAKRLKAMLKRDPNDAPARLLSDSIARDPVELLGPASYAYTIRPGDTMQRLAERLLGNRLKFYQLARYNHLDRPAALAVGQVVRIPGTPPHVAPPPRAEEPRPAAPRPLPRAVTPPRARPAPTPAAPAPVPAAVRNPEAANAARAAGLAALNAGRVGVAVQQLRRAAALDPANPAIARDLARAERIARTVQARR